MRTENSVQSASQVEKTKKPFRANHRQGPIDYAGVRECAEKTTEKDTKLWQSVGVQLNKTSDLEPAE